MTAYAVAHLRPTDQLVEDVFVYIEKIQSTLDPFGGRFLVHDAQVEVREGQWPGALVMIGFPGIVEARAWYDSPAYRELIPLRADHIPGDVVLVEGVAPGYDAAATAAGYRAAAEK
ncbi:DUF1330 domain-containing protein [Streptomyces sp. NPDC090052]|uniref:DUF1330 domain-containing protein n=1 Tax=unclassified Streptomyces TaxID=2593676 RepID=UPI00224E1092|nr:MULTISPECIES: DUF1330 domain-containing protein [unclassified Streptomyces]MCX4724212.1 DUF1330 domain-containing protein [Streptomyces sp. NBC_01306]WSV06253.1 DUF1330 domain-containing protein [Streptomyces sp. NBC_01020]WSX44380.1 DUF1330 domain-containing protein [Streptomyces sp. NBC_00963]WSX67613.1 DUF1330 domain-containing protein [Streptomyces sp. NBC_00932]